MLYNMIHDNAVQFNLDYLAYGIKEIRTSVKAPYMNAIGERFIGSVRREALDYFLLISKQQISHILEEYIDYYNSKRPHQGLEQNIPQGFEAQKYGKVRKISHSWRIMLSLSTERSMTDRVFHPHGIPERATKPTKTERYPPGFELLHTLRGHEREI